MFQYAAFGLCIHSDIELSGFAPGGDTPDITFRERTLHSRKNTAPRIQGECVSGRIKEDEWGFDLLFYIVGGREVYYHALEPVEPGLLRSFVQGPLLAGVLRQRGLLVLHGSAVSDGEHAVAFLGNSGWGKSTLAEYFSQHSYVLITDDIMVVDPGSETEPATVRPGVKQVRLRPSAAQRLVKDYESLPFVTEITQKRVRVLQGEDVRDLPLKKLYVLQPRTAEMNAITPIAPQEGVMHLVAHTHSTNWITEPSFVATHLKQCAQLLRHTPIAQLKRVLSLDELPAIFDLVQRDLATVEVGVQREATALTEDTEA